MQLILDGELVMNQEINVGRIIQAIEDYLRQSLNKGRVLFSCRINDMEVEDPIETLLINDKENNIKTVEIVTKDKITLIYETVETAIQYNVKLVSAIKNIATDINTGKDFDQKIMLQIIEGLEWLLSVCIRLENQKNLLTFNNVESFVDIVEDIKKALNSLVEAMEIGDMVTLSDIFEYELLEKLERIGEILQSYHAQI